MSDKGRIFVISAPSGTGKTTISRQLKARIPGLVVSVSCTTRKPRRGETDGKDYRFLTRKTFLRMVREARFAEWAQVYGQCYGTPKKDLQQSLRAGKTVLLTIDTQGGRSIRKAFPSAVLIGILPPSLKEQEARMRSRPGLSEKEIRMRLEESRKERRVLFREYDYRLINRNLGAVVARIAGIMDAHGR